MALRKPAALQGCADNHRPVRRLGAFLGREVVQKKRGRVEQSSCRAASDAGRNRPPSPAGVRHIQTGLSLPPCFDLQIAELFLCGRLGLEEEAFAFAVDRQTSDGVTVAGVPSDWD